VPPRTRRQPSRLQQKFGPTLRSLREQSGLAQEKLAERANLHRTHLGLLERGERYPSLRAIEKLAEALGMKPHELVKSAEDFRGRSRQAAE
jgi:transcriptional regulator with XRE-family HTH domain